MSLLVKLSGIFRRSHVWSFGVFALDRLEFRPRSTVRPLLFVRGGELREGLEYVHTNADPFLFAKDDVLYVFYEAVSRNEHGVIKGFSTRDLQTFDDLGVILKEDFHLSYPQVLELGNHVYMVPESSQAGKVYLYRFTDFPYVPEISRVLLEGSYVDSSIFHKDGMYYLFATSAKGLELHLSKDPTSEPFLPHPCSPITTDPRHSRCGGRVLTLADGMYRMAQDCSVSYGTHLNVMKIVTISPTQYEEHPAVEGLRFLDEPWLAEGSHHFDAVDFRNRTIVATDGKAAVGFSRKLRSLVSRLRSRRRRRDPTTEGRRMRRA